MHILPVRLLSQLKRRWIASCICLLSLWVAVEPPPAQAAKEGPRALELAGLMTPPQVYEQTLSHMAEGMLAGMQQAGQKLPPDVAAKIKTIVRELLPYSESVSFTAAIYAKRFSDRELKELITFYKTPVGKKLVAAQPQITGEVGARTGALIPKRLPALLKKHGFVP